MVKAVRIAVAVIATFSAAPVHADTYKWVDADGSVHFTDDASRAGRAAGATSTANVPAARTTTTTTATALSLDMRGDQVARIPFERDGHLIRLRVKLNHSIEAPFYLDTGSSGVVLPQSVARRLSLEAGPNAPTVELHTAGGSIQVPAVQLESVQIGGAEIQNLEAAVSPNIEIGLLGGEFFNNFAYSIDPVNQVMVLRRVSSPQ